MPGKTQEVIARLKFPPHLRGRLSKKPLPYDRAKIPQYIVRVYAMVVLCIVRGADDDDGHKIAYYVSKHLERCMKIAYSFAKMLDFSDDEALEFALGALFHDAGKPAMFEFRDILLHEKQATADERVEIAKHVSPELVVPIVEKCFGIKFCTLPEGIKEMIALHHCNLNAEGYCFKHGLFRGMKSFKDSLRAQMMAILDRYEAMTSLFRPMNRRKTPEEAYAELRREVKEGRLPEGPVEAFIVMMRKSGNWDSDTSGSAMTSVPYLVSNALFPQQQLTA